MEPEAPADKRSHDTPTPGNRPASAQFGTLCTQLRAACLNPEFVWPAAFAALQIVLVWLSGQDLALKDFRQFVYGNATALLVDAGARVGLYYRGLGVLSVAYAAAAMLCHLTLHAVVPDARARRAFVFCCAVAVFAYGLNGLAAPGDMGLFRIGWLWLGAVGASLAITSRVSRKEDGTGPVDAAAVLLLLSLAFCFVIRVLWPGSDGVLGGVLLVALVVVHLIVYALAGPAGPLPVDKALLVLCPFCALPLAWFGATELYMVLNQRGCHGPPMGAWWLILSLLPVLLSGWLGWRLQQSGKPARIPSIDTLLANVLFPLFLASCVLLVEYRPVAPATQELFEMANPANGVMRLFRFGEIPILQALSSHVLSDVGFRFLYVLLNGYDGTQAFDLYAFLDGLLFRLAVYYVLLRLFRNGAFALAFCLLFPYAWKVFPAFFSFVILSVFPLHRLYRRCSRANLFLAAGWIAFMLLWRLDYGVSCAFGAVAVWAVSVARSERALTDALRDVGILAGAALTLFVVTFVVCDWLVADDLVLNLRQALSYFAATQAHAFGAVSRETDRLLLGHFFLFPALALAGAAFLVSPAGRARLKNHAFLTVALVFFLGFYFGNAQRALVRHGLSEGDDIHTASYLFLLAGLFPLVFVRDRGGRRFAAFTLCSFLCVVGLKYPLPERTLPYARSAWQALAHLRPVPAQSERTTRSVIMPGSVQENCLALRRFMDRNFSPDATFIDLSYTPMLYFHTQRRVPSYFNQYMQNTVTDFLQQENLKLLHTLDVPVVVFSHWPTTQWDVLDGVPNTVRHERIAHHIYRNYRPFSVLNGYYLWLRNDISIPDAHLPPVPDEVVSHTYDYRLGFTPYALGRHLAAAQPGHVLVATWNGTTCATGTLPLHKATIDELVGERRAFLALRLANADPALRRMRVAYTEGAQERGAFRFQVPAEAGDSWHVIPIASQYNWVSRPVDRIRIQPAEQGIQVLEARMIGMD